ncbi:tetraacyldisaccharide 4'-kinase [Legionella beliardensis]|uniref:Tetraacyldisaccharide 4'-kinase n=1 Tax=Legionella beliardensis TaxID=91822 RepID=A0A378I495_9GAMM|nr:tetraacyldisaccharide 4'-kinase [Legionella beliardensis]STX29570.1 tetraacyldisaccharide 4'-kinase [Legionella beliardensis]
MQRSLETLWYGQHPLRWLLWPLSFCYQHVVGWRRFYLERFKQQHFPVPIIVVGNLTVGGVGKTPLVIALAQALKDKGLKVGIVSRGYGARVNHFPYDVKKTDNAHLVGDEPLLLAQNTDCPVVIAPKRVEAVRYLLERYQSQIIISDDGLQHYAMGRQLEILVIDGLRGLGNGLCLPAGPLREHPKRLKEADFLIVNGGKWSDAYSMTLQPGKLINIATGHAISPHELIGPTAAVAAIGHPQRFYTTLTNMGITFNSYSFPDHHAFRAEQLTFAEENVIMTAKDAVKCQDFAKDSWYFLPVDAKLSDAFWTALWSHEQIKGLVLT